MEAESLAHFEFQVIGNSPSTTISLNGITLWEPTPYIEPGVFGSAPLINPTSASATATVSFAAGGAPAANAGTNQIVTQGTL